MRSIALITSTTVCFFGLNPPVLAQVNQIPSTIEATRPNPPLPSTLPSPTPLPSDLDPNLEIPVEPFEVEDAVTVRKLRYLEVRFFPKRN